MPTVDNAYDLVAESIKMHGLIYGRDPIKWEDKFFINSNRIKKIIYACKNTYAGKKSSNEEWINKLTEIDKWFSTQEYKNLTDEKTYIMFKLKFL